MNNLKYTNRRIFIKRSAIAAGGVVFSPAYSDRSTRTTKKVQMPQIRRMRIEYLDNPLGIDTSAPRFSWEIADTRRGVNQLAYRILVASDPSLLSRDKTDLWDSGKIESAETLNIDYAGKPLESGKMCYWKVKVWTVSQNVSQVESMWSQTAYFSIGLLHDHDWKARWITSPDFIPDTPKHVGYMSEGTLDANEQKWVQIDLGTSKNFQEIHLFLAAGRRGEMPPGGEIPPGDGFPLRFKIETADSVDMANSKLVANYTHEDIINPGSKPFSCSIGEADARYVRITAVKHGNQVITQGKTFFFKLAAIQILDKGKDVALGTKVTALDSTENIKEGFGAALLTAGKTTYDAGIRRRLRPAPLLRGELVCKKPIAEAIAYATALGCYELYINGDRIGDQYLSPGYYQYEKRVSVQAYDITKCLRRGKNVAGAILGDGWYRSRYRLDGYDQFKDFAEGRFGDAIPRFLMQIHITYSDGTTEIVGTDDNWQYSMHGPLLKTSIYDGIVYDARKEIANWNKPGFSGELFLPAVVSEPEDKIIRWPMTVQPVIKQKEYKPTSITVTKRGSLIVDFGVGIGGICRLRLNGKSGLRISLRHAMALEDNETLYTKNLWGAYNNADVYVLNGKGAQTFEAPFTFHGFRYVEIFGLESEDNLEEISALMITDNLPQTATLETSDIRLNNLWQIMLRTYKSCLKSVMADVADRDERWGWLGDCGTTHAQSLAYAFDSANYFKKRCYDLRDDQYEEGFFTPKSPNMPGGGPSPVWSDAAITMAWASWINFGNKRLIEEFYPSLRKYIMLVIDNYQKNLRIWPAHFGDWLASHMTLRPSADDWQDNGTAQLPKEVFQKIALIYSCSLFSDMAKVLNKTEDSNYVDHIIDKLFEDEDIKKISKAETIPGAQSAYALYLDWQASKATDAPVVLEKLLTAIHNYNGKFTTGTVTTNTLLKVLSSNNHHTLAYNMVLSPDFPSFGYMMEQGATTLWERFDTYIDGMGYNPEPMNGLNHMGFCSVVEWIFSTSSGIYPREDGSAYKVINLKPEFNSPLNFVKSEFQSIRGPIVCNWSKQHNIITMEVTISANTTALIQLPCPNTELIQESNKSIEASEEVTVEAVENGLAVLKVPSGMYSFVFPVQF